MKIPPHFPHPTSLRHQRNVKRAMKDFPNGTGYGTIVILLEVLASQPELKYPVEDIDILSDEVGISMPIIRTVIEKYGIFSLVMDEDGESFFSISLNQWMEPYYRKIEENRIKGIKSGLARKKKIEKEIKELELSQVNSTKPQFNRSSTNRIEEKRIEERKENKTTTTSSSCSSGIYEEWLEEKCKNARNKQAYKATLLQKYKEGEKSVLQEFEDWKKHKKRQQEEEKLISFQGKKIMLEEGEIYEVLGAEDKEDGLHVYLDNRYQNSYQILFSSIEEIEKRIQHAN